MLLKDVALTSLQQTLSFVSQHAPLLSLEAKALCCAGRVSMTCVKGRVRSVLLAEYIPTGIVVCGVIIGLVLLGVCRGRQIMTELANARLNRIKRG